MFPSQLMGHSRGLSCVYSTEPIDSILQKKELLSVISFGKECLSDKVQKHLFCGLQPLEDANLKEVWCSDEAVSSGVDGQCFWSETDSQIMAAVCIDEKEYADFRAVVNDAYQRILKLIATRGYPHIIRVWNYMADITLGEGDKERYKQFCVGRYEAFVQYNYKLDQLPSASALGYSGGGFMVYLLAAKRPGLHFENPMQLNAYHYPRKYGVQSPSFARATLAEWGGGRQLFISGTASITGHESMHSESFCDQLTLICQNIDLLLKHVVKQIDETQLAQMSILKVYLRNKTDLGEAKKGIAKHFGDKIPVIFLQADLCRKELLMEIDGHCSLGNSVNKAGR